MTTFQRRQWQPTPVLLPGKPHGWRSLVGCSPGGHEESDTTERLHFHFSFSCIGEGNGNPLQCSCLENPRDRGACWAAVCGVAQSWTQLKWLSSSSSITTFRQLIQVTKLSTQFVSHKGDTGRQNLWEEKNTLQKQNQTSTTLLCVLKAHVFILLGLKVVNIHILLHSWHWWRHTGLLFKIKQS